MHSVSIVKIVRYSDLFNLSYSVLLSSSLVGRSESHIIRYSVRHTLADVYYTLVGIVIET